MRTSAWFGWSVVGVAVVLVGVLKFMGHPSNWVLGALLALAFVPLGFIIGGEDPTPKDEELTPKDEDAAPKDDDPGQAQ